MYLWPRVLRSFKLALKSPTSFKALVVRDCSVSRATNLKVFPPNFRTAFAVPETLYRPRRSEEAGLDWPLISIDVQDAVLKTVSLASRFKTVSCLAFTKILLKSVLHITVYK